MPGSVESSRSAGGVEVVVSRGYIFHWCLGGYVGVVDGLNVRVGWQEGVK